MGICAFLFMIIIVGVLLLTSGHLQFNVVRPSILLSLPYLSYLDTYEPENYIPKPGYLTRFNPVQRAGVIEQNVLYHKEVLIGNHYRQPDFLLI
jgi:hypothetical protein